MRNQSNASLPCRACNAACVRSGAGGGSRLSAARLIRLLQSRGLDAIGGRDPAAPDRFIAALHIPDDQLLVVAGHHPTPALLDHRLQQRAFRELYLDLQATPTPAGKLFVMDAKGDGLQVSRERDESFDIVYENGTKTTAFDGDWKGQKLTESDTAAILPRSIASTLTCWPRSSWRWKSRRSADSSHSWHRSRLRVRENEATALDSADDRSGSRCSCRSC